VDLPAADLGRIADCPFVTQSASASCTARGSGGKRSRASMVQSGARRHGIDGIDRSPGTLESATYRIQRTWQSSNPTLSAIHTC